MSSNDCPEPLWGYTSFDFLRALARLMTFPFVAATARRS